MTIGVCVALLIGSYIASGLVNASPVTKPGLTGPRTRGLILTSPSTPPSTESQADPHESRSSNEREIGQGLLHSL